MSVRRLVRHIIYRILLAMQVIAVIAVGVIFSRISVNQRTTVAPLDSKLDRSSFVSDNDVHFGVHAPLQIHFPSGLVLAQTVSSAILADNQILAGQCSKIAITASVGTQPQCFSVDGIPFNCDTRQGPAANFCANFFGDPAAVVTTAFEKNFRCPTTHTGFHCASAHSVYDYCISWADVQAGTHCILDGCDQAVGEVRIIHNGTGSRTGVGAAVQSEINVEMLNFTPNSSIKIAMLCIVTNTVAAVAGIATIYSNNDSPFAVDTRVGHACRVTSNLNTTTHTMLFADFYEGDKATLLEIGACE